MQPHLLSLPPEHRQGLTALHAFRQETANLIEECRDPQVARAKLDWWRGEIGRLFANQPQHPITRALAPHLSQHPLAIEYFREILDGTAMDLNFDAYPSFAQLALYCHRRGSVPALLAPVISSGHPLRGQQPNSNGGTESAVDRLFANWESLWQSVERRALSENSSFAKNKSMMRKS